MMGDWIFYSAASAAATATMTLSLVVQAMTNDVVLILPVELFVVIVEMGCRVRPVSTMTMRVPEAQFLNRVETSCHGKIEIPCKPETEL